MLRLLGILMLVSGMASAHDLVPTYPEVKESHIDNIFVVKLETWNRREGIEHNLLSEICSWQKRCSSSGNT